MSPSQHRIIIIIAFSACYAMMFFDMSGVSVILPKLQQSFVLSNTSTQWIMNSFLLTMAILLLLGGRLSDHFGVRKIFLIGLLIFLIGSAVCGCTVNEESILIGRILQGVGASLMMPTVTVLIQMNFPDNEYGKTLGTILLYSNFLYAIGPFLAGALTQFVSWRWVFWINIPLCILSFYLTSITIPADKIAAKQRSFDVAGLIIFMISISALVIAIMQGEELGWESQRISGLFITAFIGIFLFVGLELKIKEPLLEIRLFRQPIFFAANIILSCGYVCLASLLFWPIWLHRAFEFTPTQIGFAMLPATLPMIVIPRIAGAWRDHSGARAPMLFGTTLTLFGAIWIMLTASTPHYTVLLIGLLAYCFGLPFFVPNAVVTLMASVKAEHRGMASGVFSTVRQVSLAFGFALLGAMIGSYDKKHITALTLTHPEYHDITVKQVNALLAGNLSIHSLSLEDLHALKQTATSIYTHAFSYGMWSMVFFALLGTLLIVYFIPKKPPTDCQITEDSV